MTAAAEWVDPPEYDKELDWVPSRHRFEDTEDGTCAECGYLLGFGNLHFETEPGFDYDVPEIDPICRACWHLRHDLEPCPMRRSPSRPGACGCTAGVGAA